MHIPAHVTHFMAKLLSPLFSLEEKVMKLLILTLVVYCVTLLSNLVILSRGNR